VQKREGKGTIEDMAVSITELLDVGQCYCGRLQAWCKPRHHRHYSQKCHRQLAEAVIEGKAHCMPEGTIDGVAKSISDSHLDGAANHATVRCEGW